MEALRNLREAVYDLIDLRSVRAPSIRDDVYDEVGPPRHLAAPFVEQGRAINEAIEAQYGPGRDQG